MSDLERILDILKKYQDKEILIDELQSWFLTLPLCDYFTDEQIHELEYQLDYIRFCVSTDLQYQAVMKQILPLIDLLQSKQI